MTERFWVKIKARHFFPSSSTNRCRALTKRISLDMRKQQKTPFCESVSSKSIIQNVRKGKIALSWLYEIARTAKAFVCSSPAHSFSLLRLYTPESVSVRLSYWWGSCLAWSLSETLIISAFRSLLTFFSSSLFNARSYTCDIDTRVTHLKMINDKLKGYCFRSGFCVGWVEWEIPRFIGRDVVKKYSLIEILKSTNTLQEIPSRNIKKKVALDSTTTIKRQTCNN